jgi:hypothetical protein
MIIHHVSPQEWALLGSDAHRAVFGEPKPTTQDRIDFALLAVNEADDVLGYVTCKEISPETLYWSYGGAFPPASKSLRAWRTFQGFCEKSYTLGFKQILFLVENKNGPMLKMAAQAGFIIIGLRHVEGATLLEHQLKSS